MVHQLDEVGRGGRQGDLQGEVVQGFYAHLAEVGELALGVGFGIDDGVEHVGVEVTHCRVECPVPGPDVVVCGDGIAVGPAGLGIDVKGDHRAVIADIPASGHAGFGLQGVGILDRQALEQGADELVFRHAGDHVWVEALGFGAVAVVQDAQAVARKNVRLAAAAGHQDGGRKAQQRCAEEFR